MYSKMKNNYQNLNIYDPNKLIKNDKEIFFKEMVKIRENFLHDNLRKNIKVVDLCCGTGSYFENILSQTHDIVAVDNTERYLKHINKKFPFVKTVLTDASDLSQIENDTIDLLFCYSALYYIKEIDQVLHEIKRILKKDGKAILEFGNKLSLNSFISKKFEKKKNWAKSYPIKYQEIIKILSKNLKLKIVSKRHFQITSYYGSTDKYSILNIISHPLLQRFFCIKILDKMIDEWISTIFPYFSFKKIIVIQK